MTRCQPRRAALLAALLLLGACGPAPEPSMLASATPATTPAATPAGSTTPSAVASPAATAAPSASPGLPSPSPVAVAPSCEDVALPAHWWNGRVFYEVFVRSFADSDGDGIGDLRGLTRRLDYLAGLGVSGLWLMPVAEAASYHGYDVTNYERIEPDYGTRADFRAFLTAAHRRGIAVIVDLVLNHTSIDHPWFQASRDPASPRHDWYRWSDTNPGTVAPNGTPAWHPLDGRWYYAQFWEGMPDLNLENPRVTAALVDVARFWLTDLGVDGFRLDAIKHLIEAGAVQEHTPATFAWLADFKRQVEAIKPDALLVGEVFDPTVASARYVPDQVDLTFEFEVASTVLQGVKTNDASSLSIVQADALDAYADRGFAAFLTNHDQPRTLTELRDDEAAARVAASALLTSPGVPFLYYGEEVGLAGDKPDERIRTPMPWTARAPGVGFTRGRPWEPAEPGFDIRNVAAETGVPGSLLEHYRSLLATRAAHPVLRTGAWLPVQGSAPGIYAFLAAGADETLAVILNLGDDPVDAPVLDLGDATTCVRPTATLAYADGWPAPPAIAAPAFGADGSLGAWSPTGSLPPRSTLVVALH